MADETNTQTTTTETGTQPGNAAQERTFTQAQVDQIVKERMRKEFARQERKAEEKANPKPDKPGRRELEERKADRTEVKSEVDKLRDELADVRRAHERAQFESELMRDGRFRDDVSSVDKMWKLHGVEKPKDRKAWLDEMHGSGAFVRQPKQETATPANGEAAKVETAKPVAAAASAPSVQGAHPTIDGGLVDIFNLSDAQMAQLGPRGIRAEFEKILERGRSLHGAPPRPHAPGK